MHNKLISALYKALASYEDWSSDKWVHYSNINKLGINPKQFHQDPAGIYLFPIEFKVRGAIWKDKKYKIVVSIMDDTNILDISKTTSEERKSILDKLNIPYSDEKNYSTPDTWWETLKYYYILGNKKLSAKWNKDFRSLGYDAIFDDTESIHVWETQLLVLNPKKLKIEDVETQNIKRGQFSRLQELQNLLIELLKPYGEVKGEVKTHKDWIGKGKRLKARVSLKFDTKYIDWDIEEDEANHLMWVRILFTNVEGFHDNWGHIHMSDSLEYQDEEKLKKFVLRVMQKANQK